MKVLHASVMTEPAVGVLNQLASEIESASTLGIPWASKFYCFGGDSNPIIVNSTKDASNRLRFRLSFYKWLWNEAKSVDVLLLRYSFHDPLQVIFLLAAPIPVVLVHHTLEGPELALGTGIVSKMKSLADRLFGAISLSLASGVVAVTDEILHYELARRWKKSTVPSHIYPNGIMYENAERAQVERQKFISSPQGSSTVTTHNNANNEETAPLVPVLLFVSSIYAPWQGLEELVVAAAGYDKLFVCHVVGALTTEQSELLITDDRFIAHGKQSSGYTQELIEQSDVGLSALALYKKNMKSACTLKVREYMRAGLCTYAGHTDVFPEGYRYFKSGQIDLASICTYASECRDYSKNEVAADSRQYIDKTELVKGLYGFLRTVV